MRKAVAGLTALLALVLCSGASAGTLTRPSNGDGTFRYEYHDSAAAFANDLSIQHDEGNALPFRIEDAALNTATRPQSCVVITANEAMRCEEDVVSMDVFLGPGDDAVRFDHAGLGGIDKIIFPARVFGEDGNDCLEGTDQGDVIDGGTNSIFGLESGTGNDRIYGSSGEDTIRGEDGNDLLNGFWPPGASADCGFSETPLVDDVDDNIDGGAGNDTLIGGAGNDTLTDGSGPNTLVNGETAALNGGDGNDTINTGAGFVDLVDGGAGNDTIRGSNFVSATPVNGDTLRGGAGNDTITGGPVNETLEGGLGTDNLAAAAGNDTLRGDAVAANPADSGDLLTPGPGRDSVDGGAGSDTVLYNDVRSTGVTVTLDAGANNDGSVEDDVGGLRDTLTLVEHVTGTSFGDVLTGDADANIITGGGGDDLLIGLAGADNLSGGAGDDTLDGGGDADTIGGGDGDGDLVDYSARAAPVKVTLSSAGAADDDGSIGIDGATATTLDDVDTTEIVSGGSAADQLSAASTGSTLVGNVGDDVLAGDVGADTFDGGPGADAMDGKGGTDTVTYAAIAEGLAVTLNDGVANDGGIADTSGANRDSTAAVENVIGGSAADHLTGDGGANRLEGRAGDDTLQGLLGSDQLVGGDGADLATYGERGAGEAVTLTLDGAANDGASGETDLIDATVEGAQGGAGPDTLTGGGNADRLIGGDGADRLTGLAGADAFQSGAGDDTIEAKDGVAESVDCGLGVDGGNADAEDALIGCETINPPVVVIDNDKDGVPSGLDCDDNDPRRKPGNTDIPGNAIDEDCKNGPARFTRIAAQLFFQYQTLGRRTTRFTSATVSDLPAGTRVLLTCKPPKAKSRACPFKRFNRTFRKATKKVNLLPRFKKRRFIAGVTITLSVTHPLAIGKVRRITTRRGAPKDVSLCLTPRQTKPKRCA